MRENVMNTYGRFDVIFEKGQGSKLWDNKGNEYLDFVSGIAVNCLGHSHPAIAQTLAEQGQKLLHISNLYWNDKQLELAAKLANYSGLDQVFFCNSGTEATEGALKLARKYGKVKGGYHKNTIIYMENSFHGRTLGALSVTGQPKYQKNFEPLLPSVKSIKFNDINELEEVMDNNVCGVILEPIQGEGGIITANKEFLQKARELCHQYDALLMFDEVQSGIGRSGKFFAFQNLDVKPDVVCSAKGLGGGFPIGAVLANKKAASAFEPGDHGSTFGGNPLACAVAITVIREIMENDILSNVDKMSTYMISKIEELKQKHQMINAVQGMGLLLGISLNIEAKILVQKCFEKGLLLVGAGEKVVRLVPPLNVTKEEIDKAIATIDQALEEISK